jgi:murein DD-endopeptidase MepM/ murein hydrolase activator NlpD
MIKKTCVCSPSPDGNLFSNSNLLRFFQSHRANISFSFTLLCLILSISSVSAQTRSKRAGVKPEERLRRVEDTAEVSEPVLGDEANQMAQPHVRKTALTYPTRTGNQSAERPSLVNDIVIISRAEETAPLRKLGTQKAGATSTNIPSIWPVVGTLRSGVGMRNNPFGGSSTEYHKGQDIAAPTGTPISATADGVVVVAGWVKGYGNGIYIDHGNGITTRYGHLSRIDVVVGQTVKRGGHLGLVGSTGRSTGPHLHYEVRINGQPTSPLNYLPAVQPTVAPAQ